MVNGFLTVELSDSSAFAGDTLLTGSVCSYGAIATLSTVTVPVRTSLKGQSTKIKSIEK